MSETNLITRPLSINEFDQWDGLVNLSPQGTVFHFSDWIKTSATISNTNFELVGVYDNNKLIGGCPISSHRKYGLRYLTSNIPLSPYGGFLLSPHLGSNIRENEQIDNSVLNSLRQYMDSKNTVFTTITNSPGLKDVRPYLSNGWNATLGYTYIMPLSNIIWDSISRKVRNTIRKSQKLNIIIEQVYDPECFWDLNIDTYQKQNRPVPFSKTYITSMMDLAIKKKFGEMWIARMPNGDAASAEFVLWDNNMVHRWSAASNSTYKYSGATSLILYELFVEMQKRGFSRINLMAANTPHLTKFISSFNPELVQYYNVSKLNIPIISNTLLRRSLLFN